MRDARRSRDAEKRSLPVVVAGRSATKAKAAVDVVTSAGIAGLLPGAGTSACLERAVAAIFVVNDRKDQKESPDEGSEDMYENASFTI